MSRETRNATSPPASFGGEAPASGPPPKGIFRKEGEYWSVGYAGKSFRLKDTKGLAYLAHLLRHPATEFHVLDLVSGITGEREDDTGESAHRLPHREENLEKAGIHVAGLGDAGEMLDDQAKAAYRRRLSDLREQLEEAKGLGNVERAEEAEEEIDALTRELSRAVGLGGRNRKAASASERARQSVTKTIKAVVERIVQSDKGLGDILTRGIKTGTFCSYQRDPNSPIAWEFAATTVEQAEHPTLDSEHAPASAGSPQASPAVLEVSPFLLAERTAFAGRETEQRAIRAAIDSALSGRGSVLMLAGGPGVGKTRLAMEMADYAWRAGFRCAVGHCYERDEPFPFLPFVELIETNLAQATSLDNFRRHLGDNAPELAQIAPSLRRVFPDIPQPLELPPAQRRRYLFQSVSEQLARAARTRSQVRILEDLHWADESSLGLLVHLANRIAQLPVVIIGTYRDGHAENPALVRTLEELIRMGIRPLKLSGLSKDAVARILNGLSQRQAPESLVSAIFEESQGNPFFVEEVYRHLVEEGKVFDADGQFRPDIEIGEIDVPENVRLVIDRRLQRFDVHEKRVLAAAAVIGRSFSFRLLAKTSQIDVDQLFAVIEKAQQMGLIIPSSEGPDNPYAFTHELVRQTFLAGISAPRRQQMHAAVADTIESLYPRLVDERAGEISDHLLKAGSFADGRKLFHYLVVAGKSALKAAAFEEARRNFRSALSDQGAFEARERADLLASLAIAERGLERWDAVIANMREALEIYISLDDREMIGRSFTELTDASNWAGRFQEATDTAERGLTYFKADLTVERARLVAALGRARAAAGDYQVAHDALREALDISSRFSDPRLTADVLSTRSLVNYAFFRLREAVEDGFRSKQVAGLEALPWERDLQLRILHWSLLYLGRPEEALRIADELEPLAQKIGDSYFFARCVSSRAWVEFGRAPNLAQLETTVREVMRSDQKALYLFFPEVSQLELNLLDFFRGDWVSALSHAKAACRDEPGASSKGFGEGTLFRQMAYAGDHDGATALLREKRTWLPVSGKPNARGSWWMLALVIEGLSMLGEQSQAGQLYPLAREFVSTGAVVLLPFCRFTQTIAGIAAAAARHWEAAEEHFQIAMQQAESYPYLLEQAEIRRFHAMMLMDRAAPGDRQKAQTLLHEALKTYTHIGMPRHIEMARALLN